MNSKEWTALVFLVVWTGLGIYFAIAIAHQHGHWDWAGVIFPALITVGGWVAIGNYIGSTR